MHDLMNTQCRFVVMVGKKKKKKSETETVLKMEILNFRWLTNEIKGSGNANVRLEK